MNGLDLKQCCWLMHIISSPLPLYPFAGTGIAIEGLEDYVDIRLGGLCGH